MLYSVAVPLSRGYTLGCSPGYTLGCTPAYIPGYTPGCSLAVPLAVPAVLLINAKQGTQPGRPLFSHSRLCLLACLGRGRGSGHTLVGVMAQGIP